MDRLSQRTAQENQTFAFGRDGQAGPGPAAAGQQQGELRAAREDRGRQRHDALPAVPNEGTEHRMDQTRDDLGSGTVQSGRPESGEAERGTAAPADFRLEPVDVRRGRKHDRENPDAGEAEDKGGRAGVHRGRLRDEGRRGDSAPSERESGRRRKTGQSPTSRTKQWLEEQGFQVAVVEKWKPVSRFNPKTGKKEITPFGVRVDAFGFGDILACKPGDGIYLVQCCAGTDHAKRKLKILTECQWRFEEWKASGGKVLLVSWAKKGASWERKTWQARSEEL